MAQQLESKSTFPPPPPFWRMYGRPDLQAQSKIDWNKPPPPPTQAYSKFNVLQSINQTIPSLPAGVKQMYETLPDGSVEFSTELRKLNSQVLPLYTSLLKQLVNADVTDDPQSNDASSTPYNSQTIRNTLMEISHLFLNEVHLLALCRRHQAIQSLIQIMKKELDEVNASNQAISQSIDETRDLLARHGQFYREDSDSLEADASRPFNHSDLLQQSINQSTQSTTPSDADKLFAVLSNLPNQSLE